MRIEKAKGEVVISLNKKFYDLKAIKESLGDFKQVCSGKVEMAKKEIKIVLLSRGGKPDNTLGYEFCNYVLGLMKNKTLV